jgi:uncharacterized protein
MSETLLENMIRGYMSTPQPVYAFGWQGGEPTLMGLDFFRKVVHLQKKYGGDGARVANGLQTNATLIDDAFAQHLACYHYLVGCSLDGPAPIHNHYRKTKGGHPTHAETMRGIEILQRHGVDLNILILVSRANVNRAEEVYNYLVDHGFYFHQYIPCVEFDEKGGLMPFAVTARQWGDFMCAVFDKWYSQDRNRVSVRHFDSLMQKMVDGSVNVCALADNCCHYLVVEHNGDIYPCDFFVQEDLKLGNLMDTSWETVLAMPEYEKFGALKSNRNTSCRNCDCLDLCMGDCLKHRDYAGRTGRNLSVLCAGWKQIINHTRQKLHMMAEDIRLRQAKHRQTTQYLAVADHWKIKKVGRNQPCPCGSGKKSKKCCMP